MEELTLNTITLGETLRLRDDVLPLVKKRLWVFAGVGNKEKEPVFLVLEWFPPRSSQGSIHKSFGRAQISLQNGTRSEIWTLDF